jgi:hypothetical protein
MSYLQRGSVDHALTGPSACGEALRVRQLAPMRLDSQPRQDVGGGGAARQSEDLMPSFTTSRTLPPPRNLADPFVTSGTAHLTPGRLGTEEDAPDPSSAATHRIASEETTLAMTSRGVRASVVRLPPSVHGDGDHGFVPALIGIAREKGVSAYVGDGVNGWPAVHRLDAAHLFRLALEKGSAGARFHGVADEGVPVREIADVIGRRLNVPIVAKSLEEAADHFGWLAHFLGIDCPTSSAKTQERLGWRPIRNLNRRTPAAPLRRRYGSAKTGPTSSLPAHRVRQGLSRDHRASRFAMGDCRNATSKPRRAAEALNVRQSLLSRGLRDREYQLGTRSSNAPTAALGRRSQAKNSSNLPGTSSRKQKRLQRSPQDQFSRREWSIDNRRLRPGAPRLPSAPRSRRRRCAPIRAPRAPR